MSDPTGKLFVIQKHRDAKGKNGKKRLRRRKFFEPGEILQAVDKARQYATENHQDFLVVEVVAEASKPESESA